MIRAVIFDFGGVFTSSPFEAFNRYERERGFPQDLIRRINSTNHLEHAWARFEHTEIELNGFDTAFAAEAKAFGNKQPKHKNKPQQTNNNQPEKDKTHRRIK